MRTRNTDVLVRNEGKRFSQITFNLLPSGCRLDTLEGRQYTVVPMVMLTEGVHAGSQGPLFYPKDELSKTPVVWNHKPLVVYHPILNGQGISACDVDVLNKQKIGLVLNTKFEGGRLKAEAWIDKDRANAVDERIMAAVDSKEMMELSTGLFIDVENTTGKWKSEEYQGIARNFRPDHLALLPDQIGACSIADGAGLLRNQAMHDPAFRGILFKLGLVDNELSHSDVASALYAACREKFGIGGIGGPVNYWIADVFDNFFIYEKDGKFWRLGYMSNDNGVSLSDETPVQVMRKSSWVTVGATNNTTQNNMNKTQLIVAILAANCGLVETDREALNAMTDAQLASLHSMVKEHPTVNFSLDKKDDKVVLLSKKEASAPPAPATNLNPPSAPPIQPAASTPPNPAPVTNAPKVVSVQEYIQGAPREVQDVLTNAMQIHNEEKQKLIATILANKRNAFTKEMLESRPLNELRAIASLAEEQPANNITSLPNYSGQGPVPSTGGQKVEALTLPTMNFDPPGRKKTAAA